MIKIAIIDDHELVLQGLYDRLKKETHFEVVGAFTSYQDLLFCLKYKSVDVLIIDLMLKDIHGFDLIAQIKQKCQTVPKMILISGFYEPLLHKRALDLGIKAFLPKECSYDELISTVYNVSKGNQVIPDDLLQKQESHLLTESEIEILRLISDEYSNEKISKKLYISRRTVDTHVSNICAKLNVTSRVGAVREAIKLKLI
ncbi:TPA: response regulator transcription factor [Streptococcus equi subsp. zooepidemicus]|nr:response regulator transcription factor [Streptococcus equi subsp. zooepidemicus]